MMALRTIVALAAVVAGCKVAMAVDLMDVYRLARSNDARYAAAQSQFLAMQERVPQARAGVRPRAGIESAYHEVDGEQERVTSYFAARRHHYNTRDYHGSTAGAGSANRPAWRTR
jgi:hypothetical protein